MNFKQSDKYKIINNVVIYKDSPEKRFVSLTDLEGYNNGDLFKYNNEIFVLIGEYLYGITTSIAIPANISIVNEVEKIEIMNYALEKIYLMPKFYDSNGQVYMPEMLNNCDLLKGVFDEETILNNLLKLVFNNKIVNDEWEKGSWPFDEFAESIYSIYDCIFPPNVNYKRQFISNNKLNTTSYDENFILRTTVEDLDYTNLKKYENIDNDDLLVEEIEKHMETKEYKKSIETDLKFEKEYEQKEKQYFDRKEKYENIKTHMIIINNVKKNGKVIKQLKTGISILKLFLYQNIDIKIKNKYSFEFIPNQTNIYDYSFLIMNFVKSVETFLTYKLSKFDGEIQIYNKEKRKYELVSLGSEEFKKYSMLGDMIKYLIDYSSEVFNQEVEPQIINRFLSLVKAWKDKERNGYFHKHRIENIDDALEIILSSLQIIVGLELYLDK